MTTIVQSAMTAAVPVPDLSSVETQLAVQNLRSVINNNSAYIRAVDGIADEFADETGVNLDIAGALIAQSTGTVIGDFTNGNYAFNSAIAAAAWKMTGDRFAPLNCHADVAVLQPGYWQ